MSFGAFIHGHRRLGAWIKRYEPHTRLMDWLRLWATNKGWDCICFSRCFKVAASMILCLGYLCKTKRYALRLSLSSQAETQIAPLVMANSCLDGHCWAWEGLCLSSSCKGRHLQGSSAPGWNFPPWQRYGNPKWLACFMVVRNIHQPTCKITNVRVNTTMFAPQSHLQAELPLGWRGSYTSDQNSNMQLVSKRNLSVRKNQKLLEYLLCVKYDCRHE